MADLRDCHLGHIQVPVSTHLFTTLPQNTYDPT